jgi:hypothetical protein
MHLSYMPTQNIFMYICVYVNVIGGTYTRLICKVIAMTSVLCRQRRSNSLRLRFALTCLLPTTYRRLFEGDKAAGT